jgi:hypothetical protein
MQPYIFPYIGYFQLINSVDKFIVYDDVNYIKQSWINRNSILVNGKAFRFSVPLHDQSSFEKINKTLLSEKNYSPWANKFLYTIEINYKKSPFFHNVYPRLINFFQSKNYSIAELALNSLKFVAEYTGITTEFVDSTDKYNNQHLTSQARILDICLRENADTYINTTGGIKLYSKSDFLEKNIVLQFITSEEIVYSQFNSNFISRLSIIDVLMFNDIPRIREFLCQYKVF